jgi:hypothetical protein
MNLSLLEAAFLVAGVAASVGGVLLVRRLVPQEKLTENNEYASFSYSILGLIYGIYLAFTVVVVWQQYEVAEETAEQEVVILNALWRDVEVFRPEVRSLMQRRLKEYVRYVIETEWARMAPGLRDTSSVAYDQLWTDFYAISPDASDPREAAFYEEAIARMNEFAMARRMRLLASTAGLPGSMWVLLILGAAGTIIFTWFYGTRYLSLQIAATTFLSVVIIYSVLLVRMLEHPFGGSIAVSPHAYQELLATFEAREAAQRTGLPAASRTADAPPRAAALH